MKIFYDILYESLANKFTFKDKTTRKINVIIYKVSIFFELNRHARM